MCRSSQKMASALPWALCLLLVLYVHASVDCGFDRHCPAGHTCVSSAPSTGLKYGCAPFVNATVCRDFRFSCPANHACQRDVCVHPTSAMTVPLRTNVDAVGRVRQSSTVRLRVHFIRSMPPHHVLFGARFFRMQFDVCSEIEPFLPSACKCTSGTNQTTELDCSIDFLDVDEIGVKVTLALCAHPASLSLVRYVARE